MIFKKFEMGKWIVQFNVININRLGQVRKGIIVRIVKVVINTIEKLKKQFFLISTLSFFCISALMFRRSDLDPLKLEKIN